MFFLLVPMRKRQKEINLPRFTGLSASSSSASEAKRRTRSRDTRPELLLRRGLWRRGYRYRTHARDLLGRPDLIFRAAHVVVFCDGDFWHGKDWRARRRKLLRGTNSAYWVAKIESNIARDRRTTATLQQHGWTVIRLWESEIVAELPAAVAKVEAALCERRAATL